MDDPCRVEVFNSTQHLVQQIGQPLVVKLHLNDLAKVGIHQLHYKVTVGGLVGERGSGKRGRNGGRGCKRQEREEKEEEEEEGCVCVCVCV